MNEIILAGVVVVVIFLLYGVVIVIASMAAEIAEINLEEGDDER